MNIPNSLQILRPNIPYTVRQIREAKYPVKTTSTITTITEEPKQEVKEKTRYYVGGLIPENNVNLEKPEEVKVYTPEELKQQYIKETKDQINQMISSYQEQYTYWNNKYNSTSDSEAADYADRHRLEAEYHIQELQSALGYANGEYDKDELIAIAQQRASDRYTQNEMKVDYIRLQKKEEQKQIEEQRLKGFEPVYDNPLAINRKLLGFQNIADKNRYDEQVTLLEQQKKKVEMQQSKIVAIPIGYQGVTTNKGVVIQPTTKTETMPLTDFKKYTQGEDINTFMNKPRVNYTTVTLPYQTRGTSYYDSNKGYYTPTTLTTSYSRSDIPKFSDFLSETIEYPYTALITNPKEKAKEKELTNLFIFTPTTTSTRRETVSYEPTKLSVSGRIEKERQSTETLEQFKLETKTNEKINEIYNKYTNVIISKTKDKTMSDEEFNKILNENRDKAEKEANIEFNKLTSNYKGQYEEREKERAKKQIDLEFKEEFFQRRMEDVVRAGFYAIPYYGQALATKDIVQSVKSAPSIISEFKLNPLRSSIETGSSLFIFAGVGSIKGKVKSSVETSKVSEAVKQGKFETKIKEGYVKEYNSYWSKLDETGKVQVSNLLNEGYNLKEVEIQLKPKVGMEKYTPEIKGRLLARVDQQGNIIEGVQVGEITAKYKGKKVNQEVYSQVIGKIDESGNVQSLTDVVSKQYKNTFFGKREIQKPQVNRFVSETKTTNYLEKDKSRLVNTETKTNLISSEKYKSKKLLDVPPEYYDMNNNLDFDYIKRQSKPYSVSSNIDLQKEVKSKGSITGDSKGSYIISEKLYASKGKGESTRIIETTKPQKTVRLSQVFKEEKSRPLEKYKSEPVKSESKTSQILEQPAQSEYYGKQQVINVSPVANILAYGIEGTSKSLVGSRFSGLSLVGSTKNVNIGNSKIKTGFFDIDINRDINVSGEREDSIIKDRLINRDFVRVGTRDLTKTGDITKPREIDRSIIKPSERFNTGLINVPIQKQPQTEIQKQKPNKPEVPRQVTPNIPNIPINPEFKYPEEINIKVDDYQRKKDFKKEQGYYAEVYREATKERKAYWEKVNDKPLTKESALGLASREVDRSISAKGRIVKAKPKIVKGKEVYQEVKDTKDNYFEVNRYKFRDYKQKKGARSKLPNSFIERQPYRADSRGEVSQLKSSKRMNIRNAFGL